MKVFGIDTILHDACAAVVEDGDKVLSNVIKHTVMSSDRLLDLTTIHLKEIGVIIKKALDKAGCRMEDISLIAVNNSGSLLSNVIVGVSVANTLAELYNIPTIAVHHQEAHFFSNWLNGNSRKFRFPVLVFSASGGHSSIALIENEKYKLRILSEIEGMEKHSANRPSFRGVGAVYSFIAYNLELGKQIDSGQYISLVAKGGDVKAFKFSTLKKKRADIFDFSELEKEIEVMINKERQIKGHLSRKFIRDMAASFEYSISDFIIGRLINLAEKHKAKEIHLVGGISANYNLYIRLKNKAEKKSFKVRRPIKKSYSTDNAAMIASRGYYKYKMNKGKHIKRRNLGIISNLKLEQIAVTQYLDNKEELC